MRNLQDMGGAHRYVAFGDDSGLERILPGVTVHVLGPPTIDQHDRVQAQRASNPEEYWQLRESGWHARSSFWKMQAHNAAEAVSGSLLFPRGRRLETPPPANLWFARRLHRARLSQFFEISLAMDDALNNTSVILLFECGGKKLLFPGDAQYENWQYALEHPDATERKRIRRLLEGVDVYKVGHHGSRNGTPKSLWELFRKRSADDERRNRLQTILSTKANVHGTSGRGTEVPRRTLLQALRTETGLLNLDRLRGRGWSLVTLPL